MVEACPQAPKAVRRSGHRAPVCNHAGADYLCAFSNAIGTGPVPFVRHCCQFATTRQKTGILPRELRSCQLGGLGAGNT